MEIYSLLKQDVGNECWCFEIHPTITFHHKSNDAITSSNYGIEFLLSTSLFSRCSELWDNSTSMMIIRSRGFAQG